MKKLTLKLFLSLLFPLTYTLSAKSDECRDASREKKSKILKELERKECIKYDDSAESVICR